MQREAFLSFLRVLMNADTEGGQGTEGTQGTPGTEAQPGKTFTQDEVNQIATRESRAAARKASADLATELGMTVEEAKKILKTQADAEASKLSEADKAKKEAETAKAEADRLKAEAAVERHTARVERLLGKAGVDEKVLAKAARLLDIETGAEADEIEKAIDALKGDVPALFAPAPASGQTSPKTPSGMSGSKPPASQTPQTGLAAGAAEYERRFGKRTSTTS